MNATCVANTSIIRQELDMYTWGGRGGLKSWRWAGPVGPGALEGGGAFSHDTGTF